MYSKYFCALTSSQRARKHRLPFFSLKNVANIRVWLALRAGKTWLRRHRRERSADAVVSMSFFLSLALIAAILSEVTFSFFFAPCSIIVFVLILYSV